MTLTLGAPAALTMTSTDLDELCCGTIHLSVPLLDDVIQIGIGGNPDVGTIQVSKTAAALRVCRVDGKPLQADLLQYHPDGPEPVVRTTVFDEPVDCLVLERVQSQSSPGLWVSTLTIRVERHRSVGQFVRTIATFGLAKQRRGDGG